MAIRDKTVQAHHDQKCQANTTLVDYLLIEQAGHNMALTAWLDTGRLRGLRAVDSGPTRPKLSPVTFTRVNTARDKHLFLSKAPSAEAGDIGSTGNHPIADLRGAAKGNSRVMLNQPSVVAVGYGPPGAFYRALLHSGASAWGVLSPMA